MAALTVIRRIGELIAVPPGPVAGRAMRRVQRVPEAALVVENKTIRWFGPEVSLNAPPSAAVVDAMGGCVVPGLIDCHTHTVFAGTRENEFVKRIEGKSYEQIANEGGGIVVTVDAVRAASAGQLLIESASRLARMLRNGVTTVEIKSGYGLSPEAELGMLRVIRKLAEAQPVEVVATYLAAHTVPREFHGRSGDYVETILAPAVLATIRDERLAEFCDVFCEKTAFSLAEARRILTTAASFGLRPKVHADQLSQMGASRLAAEIGAVSADHLEHLDSGAMAALAQSRTVPVVLPGCSFFLGVGYAPARAIIDADLPLAIATDYNPGSSMVESLPLVLSIACTQMRLTPTQALVAATANAAAALNRHDRLGGIAPGMQADLAILDVPNLDRWFYEPGRNCVRCVMKAGRIVHATQNTSLS